MKKILLSAAAFLFVATVFAQKKASPVTYAKYINATDARRHLSILSSDAFEGRETGKPGADKAAHYIAGEFKKLGLRPPVKGSYFLDVPLVQNTTRITFTIDGTAINNGEDFFSRMDIGDKPIDANEVVFVGYGTDAEIANTDIAGKVVLWINEDKPEAGKTPNTSYRLSNARTQIVKDMQGKNPVLILAVNHEVGDVLKRFGASVRNGRLILKPDPNKAVNHQAAVVNITTAVADQLVKASGKTFDELKSAATQSIKTDIKLESHTDNTEVKAVDVLGYMPGTDLKSQVLVFSAHYDHLGLNAKGPDKVFNGADDDGSGTTGILEIARAFAKAKKDGHGPRRSILFLANVGEEKGLLGSEYYTDHPVFPLANTITDLNIDMIGRVGFEYIGKPDSANYVYTIGSAMLSKELHQINEEANNKYTHLEQDYKYDDPNDPNRFYYRSDHYNFAKHGVPIIFYFNGVHADYHQPSDEIGKINFPLLAKRAQLVFYTGWELANRNKRPVVDGKN